MALDVEVQTYIFYKSKNIPMLVYLIYRRIECYWKTKQF